MNTEKLVDVSGRSSSRRPSAVPHHFLVTSRGASATRWLSFALASHPGVFVAHGKHYLQSIRDGHFETERRNDDTASLALGNVMSDFYRCRSLDEVFDIYSHLQPAAQSCGNVHTYQLEELHSRFGLVNSPSGIRILNVIRHPVTYIASHAGMVRSARHYPALVKPWRMGFERALKQHPELRQIEHHDAENFEAFIVSCQSVVQCVADLRNRKVLHIQMEELTSDVDCLLWCCEFLTQLSYDRKRLAGFVHDGPINRHRQATAPVAPDDVYNQWEPWQRTAAAIMLPNELLKQFEAEGYDVAMLWDERRRSVRRAESTRKRLDGKCDVPSAGECRDRLDAFRPHSAGQIGDEGHLDDSRRSTPQGRLSRSRVVADCGSPTD